MRVAIKRCGGQAGAACRIRHLLAGCVLLAMTGGFSPRAASAEDEPASEPVLRLPPFLVEAERDGGLTWRYARFDEWQVLSAATSEETDAFIQALQQHRIALRTLIPDALLFHAPLPTTLILYPARFGPALDRATTQLLKDVPPPARSPRLTALNDVRLSDEDSTYLFVVLDSKVQPLAFSTEYLQFLLRSRIPALPPWFITGMMRLYAADLFPELEPAWHRPAAPHLEPAFGHATWISEDETKALRKDSSAPRALLPLPELFRPCPADATAAYRSVWESEAELLVRWGFARGDGAGRGPLWHFVAAASTRPVTETLFAGTFGFRVAAARDALSAYLPAAVGGPLKLPRVDAAPVQRVPLREATSEEVRRIKGEWSRRSASLVGQQFPAARGAYAENARHLLEGAWTRGDRDPLFLASLALFYIETGDLAHARKIFDQYPMAATSRPIARLARLQLKVQAAELATGAPASPGKAATLLAELRGEFAAEPPLEAVYALAGRLAQQLGREPRPDELAFIEEGARLFPRNASLAVLAASWELRAGKVDAARQVITLALAVDTTAEARAKLMVLRGLADAATPIHGGQ